jgi:hypothetical protein
MQKEQEINLVLELTVHLLCDRDLRKNKLIALDC